MERNPVRALQMMAGVNKTLAEAVAAENNLTSLLAGNVNTIADKSSAITNRTADNDRADRADRRAAAAAGRAQATEADERKLRADRTAASMALFNERNPGATPAQREAVRTGVLAPGPVEDKNAPAEVKLARAALDAKIPGIDSMAKALAWARSRATKPPEEVLAEVYKSVLAQPGGTAKRAKEARDQARIDLYPDLQEAPASGKREASGTVKPTPAKPPNQEAAHAQAQAAVDRGASKAAVNKRLTDMGFEPLP